MDEFVTVGSFTSLIEANAIQGRLEVAGLNARTRAEHTASLIPSLANVRVEVPREQVERAEEILAEAPPFDPFTEEDRTYFRESRRKRWALGLLFLFLSYPLLAFIGALMALREAWKEADQRA